MYTTEIPTADVSSYKIVTLKCGSALNLSVPMIGTPKPKVEWKIRDTILTGVF